MRKCVSWQQGYVPPVLRCAACCGRKSGATGLREGWDARNGQSRRVRLQTRSGAPVGSRGVVGCLGSPCGGLCSPKAQYRYRRCAGLVAAGQFFPSERCVYLTAEWRVDGRRWERGGADTWSVCSGDKTRRQTSQTLGRLHSSKLCHGPPASILVPLFQLFHPNQQSPLNQSKKSSSPIMEYGYAN